MPSMPVILSPGRSIVVFGETDMTMSALLPWIVTEIEHQSRI